MYVNARGRYFGGVANETATDVYDLPEHDPVFDAIAKAATREMTAILAGDKEASRDLEAQTRQFTTLTEDAS